MFIYFFARRVYSRVVIFQIVTPTKKKNVKDKWIRQRNDPIHLINGIEP